jgi:hypothetical protein
MVLTSVHFVLYKWVSKSTPNVTTHVGYLGSEGFDLIPQNHELLNVSLMFSDQFVFCPRVTPAWLTMTNV